LRVLCSKGGGCGSHLLDEALYRAAALFLFGEDRTSDVIGDGERRIVSRDEQHTVTQVF
jgi:hypothetical protein